MGSIAKRRSSAITSGAASSAAGTVSHQIRRRIVGGSYTTLPEGAAGRCAPRVTRPAPRGGGSSIGANGKMKILYGVVGEGMGHAMRSRVVLDHLVGQGHEIEIMASGRATDFLAKRFEGVNRIHGLHMIYEENRVRRGTDGALGSRRGPARALRRRSRQPRPRAHAAGGARAEREDRWRRAASSWRCTPSATAPTAACSTRSRRPARGRGGISASAWSTPRSSRPRTSRASPRWARWPRCSRRTPPATCPGPRRASAAAGSAAPYAWRSILATARASAVRIGFPGGGAVPALGVSRRGHAARTSRKTCPADGNRRSG